MGGKQPLGVLERPQSCKLLTRLPAPGGRAKGDGEERYMAVGTVKWFNEMKGFGFIQPDEGGPDAFVHITAVEKAGMRTLRENQRVAYDLQEDRPGKMSATNLRSADDAAPPQSAADDAAEPSDSGDSAE